jgi:cobalt-zinc-cadmium efflux system membrane fusion protein
MRTNLLMILISIFFAACSNNNSKQEETKKTSADSAGNIVTLTGSQIQNAQLQTGTIQQKQLSSVIKVNGSIDVPPQNTVSVSVPLGGYLKSTQLLPGMHVNKGQTIAVMEDLQYIELQQDYLTTKSQLQYDEADYNRQKELNQSKATSDKNYQQAQLRYNNSKATLNALAQKLGLINIDPDRLTSDNISKTINVYSPINGFVSKVDMNIGRYANPTDVLFELVNPSDIHLNLKVFEKDVEKLSIGQHVYAYTNNDTGKRYNCEIILISKDISSDRTVEVHCHFENFDNSLLPGTYMNADIEEKNATVYALPEEAILNFEAKDYVFVVTAKNTYQLTPVITGIKENDFIEVKSTEELNSKQIVTKGAYTLLMKLKNTGEEED